MISLPDWVPTPGDLFGFAADALGWSWERVVQGIFGWFAQAMVMFLEWCWAALESVHRPRLTESWFANEIMGVTILISLSITVAMMLISAIQMGWAGRPELFGDTIRNAAKAVWMSVMFVVLVDSGLAISDWMSDQIWQVSRPELIDYFDVTSSSGSLVDSGVAVTFLGPLLAGLIMVSLAVIYFVLVFRSIMIYLVAAFAPIVLAFSVHQTMRGGTRRLVSLMLALLLAKPAITLTLVVGIEAAQSPNETGGVGGAIGQMVTAAAIFFIAGLSPALLFKLFPLLSEASVTSGVLAGPARAAMTIGQGVVVAGSLGSMATRAAAGASSSQGAGPMSPASYLPTPMPPAPAASAPDPSGDS